MTFVGVLAQDHTLARPRRFVGVLCVVCAAALCLFNQAIAEEKPGKEVPSGEEALRAGEYEEGVAIITKAIDREKMSKQELSAKLASRAYGYIKLKRLENAIADLNQAISLVPDDAWTRQRRCWVNAQLEKFLVGKWDCDWAIMFAKNKNVLAASLNSRAEIFQKLGRFKSAIKDYKRAQSLIDESYIYRNSGNTRFTYGDYSGAVEDYTEALRIGSKNAGETADLKWRRGMAYYKLHMLKNAAKDLTLVVELSPDNPVYLNDRCWVFAHIDRSKEALENCDKAVRLEPHNGAFWDSKAFAQYKSKKYGEALKSISKALEMNPRSPWSLFHRALIYEATGAHDEAKTDLGQIAKIAPLWRVPKAKFKQYGIEITSPGE